MQYFLNLLWRSDFHLSLARQNLLCNEFLILIDLSIIFVIRGLLIFCCFLDIYFKGASLSKMLLIFCRNCSNEWFASWRWMSRVYSQSTLCKSCLKLSWTKDLKVSIFLGFVSLCKKWLKIGQGGLKHWWLCFQILCLHWCHYVVYCL